MYPGCTETVVPGNCEILNVNEDQEVNLVCVDAEMAIEDHEQTIIESKRHMNAIVPVNQLPLELLCLIFLFINTDAYSYLPYTWVCHHWRSVLNQNPAFWTFIRHDTRRNSTTDGLQFLFVLFGRSKSTKLDVIIHHAAEIKEILLAECHRIRSLRLFYWSDLELFDWLSQPLYALRKLLLPSISIGDHGLSGLLPAFEASRNLEILECAFSDHDAPQVAQLGPLFNRLRRLKIEIETSSTEFIESILTLLHDSSKLQNLEFTSTWRATSPGPAIRIVLPELRILWTDTPYLMYHIRAPKLVELKGTVAGSDVHKILTGFDLSSIRYLHLKSQKTTEGPIYLAMGSTKVNQRKISQETSDIFFEDVFPKHHPRKLFHIRLDNLLRGQRRIAELQRILTAVLPLVTSLTELRLLVPHYAADILDGITPPPPIEKLVIRSGDEVSHVHVLRLLSDPEFCPKLRELIYESGPSAEKVARYGAQIGRALTENLQKRKENGLQELKKITLEGCPSSPDHYYLEKLQNFDTIVDFKVVPRKWYTPHKIPSTVEYVWENNAWRQSVI